MELTISWLLVYAGLGAVLAELFLGIETGFDLVLIGTALIIGGGVGNVMDNWQIGVTVTAVLAFVYILFGRSYVKEKLNVTTKRTNVDTLIGQTGIVTKKISPHQAGQVKVGGEVWRAVAEEEIPQGGKVKVDRIEGVSARVSRAV